MYAAWSRYSACLVFWINFCVQPRLFSAGRYSEACYGNCIYSNVNTLLLAVWAIEKGRYGKLATARHLIVYVSKYLSRKDGEGAGRVVRVAGRKGRGREGRGGGGKDGEGAGRKGRGAHTCDTAASEEIVGCTWGVVAILPAQKVYIFGYVRSQLSLYTGYNEKRVHVYTIQYQWRHAQNVVPQSPENWGLSRENWSERKFVRADHFSLPTPDHFLVAISGPGCQKWSGCFNLQKTAQPSLFM